MRKHLLKEIPELMATKPKYNRSKRKSTKILLKFTYVLKRNVQKYVKIENHMCIKDTKVHTFANYYNFTLQQAIETKKMREGRFTEAELVFVLWCLVDVARHLKKNGIIFG